VKAELLELAQNEALIDDIIFGDEHADIFDFGQWVGGGISARAVHDSLVSGGIGSEEIRETIEQAGLAQRLDETSGDGGGLEDGRAEAAAQGREHDDANIAQFTIDANGLGEREAVHALQFNIDEREVKWRPPDSMAAQQNHRLAGGGCIKSEHVQLLQLVV